MINNCFVKKWCAFGKISIRKPKKASNHWKSRNVKNAKVWPTFLTKNYIFIVNLLLKCGLTLVIFLWMRKTWKRLVLQKNLYLFNAIMQYYKARRKTCVNNEKSGQTERLKSSAKYSRNQHVSSHHLLRGNF